ncbi:iron sulfur cluster assembly protein-like protein 1 [Aureobasidium subglaciale]|nr:iron sulfur cluster assembly protein-like protein 1 [Aureobasidium subglaciale]KAI5225102.1 iron sulfur cluster assembly protein-like protein 1 [Aureobasidium subglaciale]KAI5228777.1 iron sulfur cluster assembly protein-like protein 1 [Aureobasidium subglaciale]KAI5253702.1 iron sulfur cluster assembly protein-like protein 1 [Aureobasidium subglaciale]KAI5263707.1 iron sulfur cluster assembly protein-like protein 1 [Aureobasidium subglaciale]
MFRRVASNVPAQASRAMAAAVRPSIAPSFRAAAPAISAVQGRRNYHEKDMSTHHPWRALPLLDHYSKPRNVGSMQKGDTDVGTGLVGAPACGDVMKLQIRVDPNDNTISEVKFKTFGCGSAIASSSYLTELVKGMTLEQAGRIKNTEIAKELCLPPVKLHCSMLAEDAIKSAISNYYTKNPNARKTDLGGTSAPLPKVEVETVSATA